MKHSIVLIILIGILFLASCTQEKRDKPVIDNKLIDQQYLNKGKEIASATFNALSAKLQAAIKEGGIKNAIEYCNLAALPVVDSLSAVHGANIRRTSLKVRNPQDAPTVLEKEILTQLHNQVDNLESIGPQIERTADQFHFFAPITVNAFCLQCHGIIGKDLTTENYSLIKEQYPEDQATGYVEGDLRGMWSIAFVE